MPRFFFHIHDGEDFPGTAGTELPSQEAARAEAIRYAGEVMRDTTRPLWREPEWQIIVTNEDQNPVLTLRFIAETPAERR